MTMPVMIRLGRRDGPHAVDGPEIPDPVERMHDAVATWRRAKRAYAGRLVYGAILIAFTAILAGFVLLTGLVFPVPLLVLQTLLTGFMLGALPWRAMRQDASVNELWFVMSFQILHAAARQADGLEGIILGSLARSTAEKLRIAPRSLEVRMDHLRQAADAMEQSRDPEVRLLLARHVQLTAIAMGAKPSLHASEHP
jgi:hypothetical protein